MLSAITVYVNKMIFKVCNLMHIKENAETSAHNY